MPGSGLDAGDVRIESKVVRVLDSAEHILSEVSRPVVEIEGETARLVIEILDMWMAQQNRRVSFLRTQLGSGANLKETRDRIDEIVGGMNRIGAMLQAWEGVLTLPKRDPLPGTPDL